VNFPATNLFTARRIMGSMVAVTTFNHDALRGFCQSHDITRLRVFGSFARGEAAATSDIDLIADFSSPKSLFEIIRIERDLSTLMGRGVDLLTEGAISPYIKDRITDDIQVVYEAR